MGTPFDKFLFVGGGTSARPVSHKRIKADGSTLVGREAGSLHAHAVKRQRTLGVSATHKVGGDGVSVGGLKPKLGSKPLRLILVGHNPSEHAWKSGHYYSNPSNRMWKILKETGIQDPKSAEGAKGDDVMPEQRGVGFIDVGVGHPGTDSSKFSSEEFLQWKKNFYSHLESHLKEANKSIGCLCGACGAPKIVAFTGKRQFVELLNVDYKAKGVKKVTKIDLGPQQILPSGWPFPKETDVWVLTSTSGASALTNEARIAPYKALSQALEHIPWPLDKVATCGAVEEGKHCHKL